MTFREMRYIMRESRLARWQSLRRLGHLRYILLYGVVGAGLPMFLLWAFVMPALTERPAGRVDRNWAITAACIAFLFGLWSGWSDWKRSEGEHTDKAHDEVARQV